MLPKEGRHLDKLTPANLRIEDKKKVANEISSENVFLAQGQKACLASMKSWAPSLMPGKTETKVN